MVFGFGLKWVRGWYMMYQEISLEFFLRRSDNRESSDAHTAGTDRRPEFTPLAQLLGQSRTNKHQKPTLALRWLLMFVGGFFLWNNRKNF
jgi:hypothetical protein